MRPIINIKDDSPWDHLKPINGVRYAKGNVEKWSDEKLASIGLKRLQRTVRPKPVAQDPLTKPINKLQFKITLRKNRLYDAVVDAISKIDDPDLRASAMTRFEDNDVYLRTDPLFEMLSSKLGLSPSVVDALWIKALGE